MEKRTLKFIFMALLVCAAQVSAQTAQFRFGLTVTDNAGGTQQLFLGVDPTGTDGIDLSLGEAERPPFPPTGVFDARMIGTDIGISGLGQGLINDFRQGTEATSGTRLHELIYQVGNGTTITISWVLPTWATGRLQDIITVALIDVNMTTSGNDTVNTPKMFNKLNQTVT